MSAPIKQYKFVLTECGNYMTGCSGDGDYVLHADHLASHAYDEAVERQAFEASYPHLTKKRCVNAPDIYWSAMAQNHWEIWLRCAKSRAKRAGGAE